MDVFTIGHSRHTADHFVSLLRAHAIGQLVDVRSQPRSKWAPHFDEGPLVQLLVTRGIRYVFLGRQLGGRPEDRAFYQSDGSVNYARRAASPDFKAGIQRLVELSHDCRTAVMCAEEDPTHCHRRLLVAPALALASMSVVHVRGDGLLEAEVHDPIPTQQLDLFRT